MGRDTRVSKVGYDYRVRLYDKEYKENESLTQAANVIGIFYAKKIDGVIDSSTLGLVKTIDKTITLETIDMINIDSDMFIDFNNEIYRVINVVEKELTFGYRPAKIRTIIAKGSGKGNAFRE